MAQLDGDGRVLPVGDLLAGAYVPDDGTPGIDPPRQAMGEEATIEGAKDLLARVEAIVKSRDATGLFDRDLLESVAAIRREIPEVYGAIKAVVRAARGFSVRDFEAALRKHDPRPVRPVAGGMARYEERDGCLGEMVVGDDGDHFQPLCDFTARIFEEVLVDDGDERPRRLRVTGSLADGSDVEAELDAGEFASMDWVVPGFGPMAIVAAGKGVKDRLRAAIQSVSGFVPRRTIYGHTGWRQVGGSWVFLHSGGALGADGQDHTVPVELNPALANFELPAPPVGEERVAAVRASLGLLGFGQGQRQGSRAVAAAAVSLPYRAVLGGTNYAVQLIGPSGSHKTCIAALIQQHFGPRLDYRDGLGVGWNATANALEGLLNLAKDVVMVVDDFVPNDGGGVAQEKAQRDGARLLRGQGNLQGRHRMRRDASLAGAKPPRGTLVTTGEDRVRSRSAHGRTLPIWFQSAVKGKVAGTIDREVLTACQADADAGLYAASLAAFVAWLAPRLDQERASLAARALKLRASADLAGGHSRTPDIVADLFAGFEVFARFAEEVGAIDPEESCDCLDDVWEGLLEAAEDLNADVRGDTDAERFLRLVAAALVGGQAHVVEAKAGARPEGREAALGWALVPGPNHSKVWQPRGPKIGWIKGQNVYLEPEGAFAAAQQLARGQGEPLGSGQAALIKQLGGRRLLLADGHNAPEGKNRSTLRKTCEGVRRNVLGFRLADVIAGTPGVVGA